MSAKILIVDDDPELLRLIGFALHRAGYRTIAAVNAEEALKKVSSEEPDLVILDVMLPGVSGIDICRQLRSQAPTQVLPIIMLSARVQVNEKIEGLEAGADDYLTKPINPKEMVARVASLLQRTERLRSAPLPPPGTLIAVLGAKGGVGVTTIALNLAVALSHGGATIAAVELHPHYGTFAVHLGNVPPESLEELAAMPASDVDERAVRNRLIADAGGIDVLYGPFNNQARVDISPEQVEALIGALKKLADIVVLDLPNDLSPATEAALRLSDQVLHVTRPEEDSLASGRKRLDMIKSWGIGRGMIDTIVVNHVPLAMGINIQKAEQQLGSRIVSVIPPAADACALAYKRGRPLIITQPNSLAAAKIRELADCYAVAPAESAESPLLNGT